MNKDKPDELYDSVLNLYKNSFVSINKISKSIVNFYYLKYNYLEMELIEHLNNEPFKFLKKKYEIWENKKVKLEQEKEEVLQKIIEELNE